MNQTQQQPQPKLKKGTVHITAVLQNPQGVWDNSVDIEYPEGAQKFAVLNIWNGLYKIGLVRDLSEDSMEVIPACRILNCTLRLEEKNIELANVLDAAVATRGGFLQRK